VTPQKSRTVPRRPSKAKLLACCLNDQDRQALTDLVSSLAFDPMLMSVEYRRWVVGRYVRTTCTYCGRPRVMCVGGCDLIPVTVWRVPD
jgi:hypothetical protein